LVARTWGAVFNEDEDRVLLGIAAVLDLPLGGQLAVVRRGVTIDSADETYSWLRISTTCGSGGMMFAILGALLLVAQEHGPG